jgi:hypothetical protein
MKVLKKIWEGWKAFGRFMGNMVARVALSIFYFTVFVPFAVGVRLATDPLQLKGRPDSLWRPRTTGDRSLEDVERQY